jgi:serine/threonine-protein kinase
MDRSHLLDLLRKHGFRCVNDETKREDTDTRDDTDTLHETEPDTRHDTGTLLAAQGSSAKAPPTRLRLMEEIGRGGMAVVIRSEQLDLARPVAVKRLLRLDDPVARKRFLREARLTAQLEHPNVVPVHQLEVGEDSGSVGYVMKLVEGRTLRALLRDAGALTERGEALPEQYALPARLEIFLKLCEALAFAHDKRIIHRDLKPANVMIGRFGEVYLMDWGIAKHVGVADEDEPHAGPASTEGDLTVAGDILGTASYMSPEQAAGRNRQLDELSDQYSLGLMLFEVVSLRRAIDAPSFFVALERAQRGHKAALEPLASGNAIAPELHAIVMKATALEPADRYPSVAALADDVRRFLRGDAVAALPEGPLAKVGRAMSRHRRTTFVAIVTTLALSLVAAATSEVRRARGALEARERTDRRTAISIEVATQAHRIDAELERMEVALEGLTVAATWALDGPEPDPPSKLYFAEDFAQEKRRPDDFRGGTAYRWEVSLQYPVVQVAPGVDRSVVLPKIRRLAPLAEHFRSMLVRAKTNDRVEVSADEALKILRERSGPIDYAYVDLAEGVHIVYPGMNALIPNYDVRQSSFYLAAKGRHGKVWSVPYVDATTAALGDDLVLPCVAGVWSRSGAFLGVAGVELTVTKLVETSLVLPHRTTLRASLVDRKGRTVIDSREARQTFRSNGRDESVVLEDFDVPEVASAIRAGKDGLLEVRRAGVDEIAVFVHLDVLDWWYVVELAPSVVEDRPGPPRR